MSQCASKCPVSVIGWQRQSSALLWKKFWRLVVSKPVTHCDKSVSLVVDKFCDATAGINFAQDASPAIHDAFVLTAIRIFDERDNAIGAVVIDNHALAHRHACTSRSVLKANAPKPVFAA